VRCCRFASRALLVACCVRFCWYFGRVCCCVLLCAVVCVVVVVCCAACVCCVVRRFCERGVL
jgi:hypothetical protein